METLAGECVVRLVRSIQINADSVDLAYMDDTDVRMDGHVMQTHHLSVNRGGQYDTEIDELEASAEHLVTDVLVDFANSPVYDPAQNMVWDDDDDDNEGEDD